jgi:signal transduction histidine kinase
MKKITLVIVGLLYSALCFSESNPEVDSLYKQLINIDDSLKAGVLNNLSWELRNSEPEKSIDYGKEAIRLAESHNDYENLVKSHSFIGVAYRILGNYSEAIDYYYKGLELAKKYGEIEQEGYAYINIGNLHIYQEYYYNAIENLEKAREIAEEIDNKRMLAYVHLNIGRAQMLRNEHHEALLNFNKALDLRIEIDQLGGQAVCYKYIGDIYRNLLEYNKALESYNKSLEVVNKESDMDLFASTQAMIARVYMELGNFRLSKEYANKSLKVAHLIGAKLILRDNIKILADISLKKKDYKSAANYLNYIIEYNDTLFNQQLSEKIFNLEYKFEKQRKQAEFDILTKDKKIQDLELSRAKTSNITLIVILILITSMLGFVMVSLKNRREKNFLLEKQKADLDKINKTKDRMFLIISHDLRGPIGNLKSLIEILLEDEEIIQNKSLMETFSIFMKSIQSVSDLLENLLLWAKSQRGDVSFDPENITLNTVVNRNLQLFKSIAEIKGIDLKVSMEDSYEVYADKNMLMTVVRNIISNAIKYTPKGGEVKIVVDRDSQFYKVSISDNGIGFDKETADKIFDTKSFYTTAGTNNEAGSGLGLLLCKEFTEKNGGKIWANSVPGKGANFYFSVPIANFN